MRIVQERGDVTASIVLLPGTRLNEKYLTRLKSAVNNPQNPVKYLSVDPGKANGVCGYDERYYLSFMLSIQADDMVDFLDQFENVEECVCESFILYPEIPGRKRRTPVYSDMETSRVIGRVESWTKNNSIELHMQPANIKPTAYKWLNEKPLPKSNPANHMKDAHAHFIYWAVVHGRIPAEDLVRRTV